MARPSGRDHALLSGLTIQALPGSRTRLGRHPPSRRGRGGRNASTTKARTDGRRATAATAARARRASALSDIDAILRCSCATLCRPRAGSPSAGVARRPPSVPGAAAPGVARAVVNFVADAERRCPTSMRSCGDLRARACKASTIGSTVRRFLLFARQAEEFNGRAPGARGVPRVGPEGGWRPSTAAVPDLAVALESYSPTRT